MVAVNNLIARIPGAGKLGFHHIDDKDSFKGSAAIVAGITKQLENNNPFKAVGAANPMAYMKQMPASNWERMGLVIGGGGGTNYNQQTAKNTGTMTKTLEQILRAFTASKAYYNAQGLPSTP